MWPEGAEPKFTRKRTPKATRVAYDTKTKRYTYQDNNAVAAGEPIRLETSDAFFHFGYHPERKEYIRIKSQTRLETDAKYVTTVSSCHWIRERSVTVIALLTYATWNAQITQNHLKTAVREAPTKEVLHLKFVEHGCYIELVETIIKAARSYQRTPYSLI